MTERPIRKYLQDRIDMPSRYRSIIEAPLLEHGRPFAGIARPKGYHLKPTKNCFMNAVRNLHYPNRRALVSVSRVTLDTSKLMAIKRGRLRCHPW